MIQLEKYCGTKSRHTCPKCGRRNEFTRFIDTVTGECLPDDVGICNRASNCGYRYTAKQYFADNQVISESVKVRTKKNYQIKVRNSDYKAKSFDYIAPENLDATLGSKERNDFVRFLFNLFPDDAAAVRDVLRIYFVGTYEDYTCFPSIDGAGRICRAKLIRFDATTGKRLKGNYDTSSLPAKLKLKEDFQYKQIFFGEHLLLLDTRKPVAIVESEKTAIIASLCMPQLIWMATGSKQWLKVERLRRLGNRQIILFPDADGFDLWKTVASNAQKQGSTVKVSALIENFATCEQRQNQYDLADYLIEQQQEINQSNEFIDDYNTKLGAVLSEQSLFAELETILDEQKAILMDSGNLSEDEAEGQITRKENLRNIVLSL